MVGTMTATSIPLIQSRIPITVFRIVTIVTLVLTLLAVICRLFALIPQRKRLGLDDILLIFATVFWLTGTTILFINLDLLYFNESLLLNGLAILDRNSAADWIGKAELLMKFTWTFFAINWASIYFVKFSFLTFFSGLCNRLPKLEVYRKIVYGFCFAAFLSSVMDGPISCPHLGLDLLLCVSNSKSINKIIGLNAMFVTIDISTDIMILVIPISLLWRVKLRAFQKVAIGIFLCLNVVMTILAITRVAGVQYYNQMDGPWIFFWQQLEASAAVTTISLAAFRSFFASNMSRSSKPGAWKASLPRFFKRSRSTFGSYQDMDLHGVPIPHGTITGMQTAIGNTEDDVASLEQSVTDYTVYYDQPIQLPAKALISYKDEKSS